MTNPISGAAGVNSRAHAEAMLARYPDLSDEDIIALRHWFRKEATALDVAQVASNEAITDAYRAFRAAHVDRFTPEDMLKAMLFISVISACLLVILWRAF